ncbi:MAG: alanine--tRNA ligase [SAR324 cluster bacterium]|nr:alanine--tRNA ligase [SAR324 cluster bacterium]
MKTSQAIRKEFISFFEDKNHKFVRSSPVVPQDDPTLLFTNAGMNQFKDVFLETGTRDYARAVNSQKCIRASGKHNDLEDVGRDNYHHTFFEMLGNWSFGDYFKREAIAWAWELLVEKWGLPADSLYATVFGGSPEEGLEADDVAAGLWTEVTPLPEARVLRCGKKDNFWEMGEIGPCGPCSEVHMDLGEGTCPLGDAGVHECQVNQEGCWRFIELWNLVFIQFNRLASGELEPLPAQHVDTGMGLERITRVLQGKQSNYDSDLFTPILDAIAEITGVPDAEGEVGVAFRVIADHLRSLTFAISDGALPSNEGRGYVLRRMLRRAARFGKVLGMQEPFIHKLVPVLGEVMGDAFPELRVQAAHAARVIKAEEESFAQTLDRGLEIFERVAREQHQAGSKTLPGEEVFRLYDTYGFPVDLTRLMAEEQGLAVDMEAFEKLMEGQRAMGKAASQGLQDAGDWTELAGGTHSAFEGYDTLQLETRVHSFSRNAEGELLLVLERTPFYAEGGGQVGDQGRIYGEAGEWRVSDVQRDGGRIVHICQGATEPDQRPVTAEVDAARRGATTLNHTATHLLHRALKNVLGDHVNQAGSVVHPDYLRFDYTHFEKPGTEQLEMVERMVNQAIRANTPMKIYQADYDTAIANGVTALFGEKYGDQVRVVEVPEFTAELCGGCHVRATGDIGILTIVSESSIASGVRRIAALTGEAAEASLRKASKLMEELQERVNASAEELPARIEGLLEERKKLEQELRSLKKSGRAGDAKALLDKTTTVNGVTVLSSEVNVGSVEELRGIADSLRKEMKKGVALIGAVIDGKASLLCVVTDDLVKQNVKAGEIVNLVAEFAEGRGGGPPHMATAGAKNPGKLPLAVQQAPEVISAYLSKLSDQVSS